MPRSKSNSQINQPPTPEELPPLVEAETVDEAAAAFATQIGEEAANIRGRRDIEAVLQMMGKGVVISLSIERPRFVTRLSPADLGLSTEGAGGETLKNYFQLGRRSLIPKELQDSLNRAEANARYTLESCSTNSHWGHFVPVTRYARWKAANEAAKEKFFEARDRVVREYADLVEQVSVAYRSAASDVWNRQLWQRISDLLQLQPGQRPTPEATRKALAEMRVTTRERDEFIENYVREITAAMPSADSLAARFVYRTEIGYIPLPSTLARDLGNADRFYQERAEQNAAHQAEMAQQRTVVERAEAEAYAATEIANAEVWAARQAQQATFAAEQQVIAARSAAELERIRLQKEMDADVLKSAQEQKELLVQEFYGGIVGQINQLLFEVCDNAGQSIERNKGKLPGSISKQLRNLVEQLAELNFMADEAVDAQIAQLQSILPVVVDDESGATARIDTSRMSRVLGDLRREAEAVLIDLGHAPVSRKARVAEANESSLLDLEIQPRQRHTSGQTAKPDASETGQGRKRREW